MRSGSGECFESFEAGEFVLQHRQYELSSPEGVFVKSGSESQNLRETPCENGLHECGSRCNPAGEPVICSRLGEVQSPGAGPDMVGMDGAGVVEGEVVERS